MTENEVQGHQPFALIKPIKFYGGAAYYLVGLSETKNHPNVILGAMSAMIMKPAEGEEIRERQIGSYEGDKI